MRFVLHKKVWLSTVILALLAIVISQALDLQSDTGETIQGIVTKVKDGDTIVIETLNGERSFICRLEGIDSPERENRGKLCQPYAAEATEALKGLIYKQQVSVTLTGEKSYRREICLIKKDSVDINREMVRRGYAWAYREYLKWPHAMST